MEKKVGIVRINELENISHLKERLQELLEPFGGIGEIIGDQAKSVLLKPNLVSTEDYTKGATTNPYLVKALVRLIKEESSVRIVVADGSSVGKDTEEVLQATGYYKLLSSEGVEIRDLKEGPFTVKEVPGGKVIKELKVPELLDQIDMIINLPVIKTHDALSLTLGLKNIKGIIHESDKKKFHRIGLAQAIIDLNKLIKPDFTIYDGTVAMEGLGPTQGEPVNLKLILAARDVVAGDLVAARIMGFEKEEVEQILLAEKDGLGRAELSEIKISGPAITEVVRPFNRYSLEDDFYQQYGITIKGDKGCSGCRNTLDSVVRKLDYKELEGLRNSTIFLGPVADLKGEKEDNILLGSCLHQHRDRGEYVFGCPPHPLDLVDFLKKKSGSAHKK